MIIALTATGKDHPGIIAALSGAIYRAGGNLEDASMTILEGEFAMILLAELRGKAAYGKLTKELRRLERDIGLVISIKEIKRRLVRGEKHQHGTMPWVVSVLGKDKTGIVYRISKMLSDFKLNITDLNSKIIGRGSKTTYALVLEVDIPKSNTLLNQVKRNLRDLQAKLGVHISLNALDSARF